MRYAMRLIARGDAEDVERMTSGGRTLDEITGEIVDAAYAPRTGLGPDLLESAKDGLHRIVNGLMPSASPRLRVNRTTTGQ